MRKRFLLVVTAILLVFCLCFAACGEKIESGRQGGDSEASGGGQTLPEQNPSDGKNNQDDKNDPPADNQGDEKEDDKNDPPADNQGDEKEDDKNDPPADNQGDEKEDDENEPAATATLTFEKSGSGYFVTGDGGESETIVIPATYENLPVIGIKESAFAYSNHKADILSVTIPDSVTKIEKNAFYSRQELKEVKIGEGSALETIENNAFSGCRALEAIYLPAGISSLGDSVFNNCGNLNEISVASANTHYSGEGNCLIDLATHTLIRGSNQSQIPNTVTTIGDAAFRWATLKELTIPVSVTSIGKYIIQDSEITSIVFAGTLAQWESIQKSNSWNMGKKDVIVTYSEEGSTESSQKILVAYFSCTNNTEKIAKYIAEITGGTLYEIKPKEHYTDADLNYNTDCRANREQNDASARPEIEGSVENMEQYDVVYLGYPIWWGQAPKIIYTFLESYDFSGKTVIPFCTSGSSGIGTSATNLHASASNAKWLEGKRFSGSSQKSAVEAWIKELDD